MTLGRQLYATLGAPGAGSRCHFRLSTSQFCESHNKTSKFKVLKKSKICAFDFLIVNRSFVLLNCVCPKTLPAFLKKKFVTITSVCPQNESWKSKMTPAASTWRLRVNRDSKIFCEIYVLAKNLPLSLC